MRRPQPLPEPLRGVPFSVGAARAMGVTAGRLDASDLEIPFRGVRIPRGASPPDIAERCAQYAPRLRPWQFFSHDTALARFGAPLPLGSDPLVLHVSAHRPNREPRAEGVVGHRLGERSPAVWAVGGIPFEHPARAWRHVGAAWQHDDLVAAGDYIVGRGGLVTLDQLVDEVELHATRGRSRLIRALSGIRPGSESSEETRLRLVLQRAGLPEPELNPELRQASGVFIARLDLAYRRWRVAVEYDGRQHAFDDAQFARDADRWHAIRASGWEHVRILRHHLRGDGRRAVDMVRSALLRAGWRP